MPEPHEGPPADSTVNRVKDTISAESAAAAPAAVGKKKHNKRLPEFLRSAEIEQLLASARADVDKAKTESKRAAARRDLVMVLVGFLLGLRVSELCKLRVEDVDLVGGSVMVLLGKGSKDRLLPIAARLYPALREWLAGRTSGWVFHSCGERKIAPRTFQDRLKALGLRAGIQRNLHPHVLRHSFATALLERGASIREVQELLGHENLATTEKYTHCTADRLKGAVDRL